MRPRLTFDFSGLLADARRKLGGSTDGIEICLPHLSVCVSPSAGERSVAMQIAVRSANRSFLNRDECCLRCRDSALSSLREIEHMLVRQQTDLSVTPDGPVAILIDYMLEGIRQFTAFERAIGVSSETDSVASLDPASRWPYVNRRACLHAMELLRTHSWCCLRQVESIANVRIASVRDHLPDGHAWQLEAYRPPVAIAQNAELAWGPE